MKIGFDNGQPVLDAHDLARLTFFHAGTHVRLTCDTAGKILSTLRPDIGDI